MAPQLTLMKGLSRRVLDICRARANSSLPVPDSPSSSTVDVGGRHLFDLAQGVPQRRRFADDAERGLLRRAAFERPLEFAVFVFQPRSLFRHPVVQFQDLGDERGDDFEYVQIVGQRPGAPANAVHAQQAQHLALAAQRQPDEAHGLVRQAFAIDRAREVMRIVVDVLHDRRFAALQRTAGDAVARLVDAAFDFRCRQAVGIANRKIAAVRLLQDHASAVQPEKLRDQVQHFADHRARFQALADQARRFADHQQFLVVQTFGRQVAMQRS